VAQLTDREKRGDLLPPVGETTFELLRTASHMLSHAASVSVRGEPMSPLESALLPWTSVSLFHGGLRASEFSEEEVKAGEEEYERACRDVVHRVVDVDAASLQPAGVKLHDWLISRVAKSTLAAKTAKRNAHPVLEVRGCCWHRHMH
jgi:hypothetical protein